jgi:cobalt-zinc-cadmium efflux system membrane fusion protein
MMRIALATVTALLLALHGCGTADRKLKEAAHDEHDHGHAEQGHEAHGHAQEPAGNADHAHHAEDEAVRLTPEQERRAGILLATAGPATIGRPLELPGEVVLDADRLSHIVPRFPGVAREVRKSLGDRVKAGDVLAVINSNQSLSSYDVTSLTAGVIIEKHITLGEFVTDDQDIYVVADLSQVWVNLTVYPRDMSAIRVGQDVSVRVTGFDTDFRGTITYIGPIVGEQTRTALARVVLPNRDGALRPGLFVTARVFVDNAAVPLAVRDEALQTLEGENVVFVEESGGVYMARAVEVGATDGEWAEITSGLTPGQKYVSRGAFILKSEKLKSEAGHDH